MWYVRAGVVYGWRQTLNGFCIQSQYVWMTLGFALYVYVLAYCIWGGGGGGWKSCAYTVAWTLFVQNLQCPAWMRRKWLGTWTLPTAGVVSCHFRYEQPTNWSEADTAPIVPIFPHGPTIHIIMSVQYHWWQTYRREPLIVVNRALLYMPFAQFTATTVSNVASNDFNDMRIKALANPSFPLLLYPGGIPEAIHNSVAHCDCVVYLPGTGLFELALLCGRPILPCMALNENSIWAHATPVVKFFRAVDKYVTKKCGIPTPACGVGWIPFLPPTSPVLQIVFGAPLYANLNDTPNTLRARYTEGVKELIQRNEEAAGRRFQVLERRL